MNFGLELGLLNLGFELGFLNLGFELGLLNLGFEYGLSEGEMDCIELAVSYKFLYVNADDNSPCKEILSSWIIRSVRDRLWRRIVGRCRRDMNVLKANVLMKNCVKEHKVCEEME